MSPLSTLDSGLQTPDSGLLAKQLPNLFDSSALRLSITDGNKYRVFTREGSYDFWNRGTVNLNCRGRCQPWLCSGNHKVLSSGVQAQQPAGCGAICARPRVMPVMLDDAKLLEVARYTRLRCRDPSSFEKDAQFFLRADWLCLNQAQ